MPARASFVEAVFKLSAPIIELRVGSKLIKTTAEHPFFVQGVGWVAAHQLKPGNPLLGYDAQVTPVDSILLTETIAPVYNLRVAEDHTYFVGSGHWGFSVWVHNTYKADIDPNTGEWVVRDERGDIVARGFGSEQDPGAKAKAEAAAEIYTARKKELDNQNGSDWHKNAPKSGLANATRLSPDELATGQRLESLLGKPVKESPHVGAEYIDDLGRSYDALGTPNASKFWNEKQFLKSIDGHLLKSNDFTVIDLTGFSPAQINAVRQHL